VGTVVYVALGLVQLKWQTVHEGGEMYRGWQWRHSVYSNYCRKFGGSLYFRSSV